MGTTPTARPLGFAKLFQVAGTNPYVPLLYEQLAARGLGPERDAPFRLGWLWRARHDVTFLQFGWGPDDHYVWRRLRGRPRRLLSWSRLGVFAGRLLAARMLGYRVVWTIHEVYPPHSAVSRRLDRLAGRVLARASDVLLAHDDAVAEQARAVLGRAAAKINVVPHGSYVGVYPRGRDRAAVRAELGIAPESFVFLCFGTLRRDKAIGLLIDAFRALPHPNAVLVVAGRVKHRRDGGRVIEAAASDPRIRPLLRFVPNDRVAELFGAADAAVLARSEIWTSGSLILALSLGVPVVAARLPMHEALSSGERAGWLFEPGDAASLRRALERAMEDAAHAPAKRAAALEQAARLPPWSEVAESIASFMLGASPNGGSAAD